MSTQTKVTNVPLFIAEKIKSIVGEPVLFAKGTKMDYYVGVTVYNGEVRYLIVPFNNETQGLGRYFGYATDLTSTPAIVAENFKRLQASFDKAIPIAKAQAEELAKQVPVATMTKKDAKAEAKRIKEILAPLVAKYPVVAGFTAILDGGDINAFMSAFKPYATTIPELAQAITTIETKPAEATTGIDVAPIKAILTPMAVANPALLGFISMLDSGNVDGFVQAFNAYAPTQPTLAPLIPAIQTMLAPKRS